MSAQAVQADLTWIDGRFEHGVRIECGVDGRISSVVRDCRESPTHPGMAVLPGFVNSHSHAFQRALRGLGERFPGDREDFWTWREAMYGLVDSMDASRMHALCVSAFTEMRRAGITSVGEFHYLHHPDDDRWSGDRIVLEAAREAGIRIVLLQAHYVSGGFGEALQGGQRRFDTSDPDTFWRAFDRASSLCTPGQTMGVVGHSIRAVPVEQLIELHEESRRRDLVFHMHVEEQPAEIEACQATCGCTPTGLLLDRLRLDERFTAVHDTHTLPSELEAFLAQGSNVCLCPLTEANLGDGLPAREVLQRFPEQICVGSDSNSRISMLEELRMLELAHRLQGRCRGVWADENGAIDRRLMDMATINGARSLGLDVGRIVEGAWADLALVDLQADVLQHVAPESLGAALVLGVDREVFVDTCVGGRWGRMD